MSTPQISDDDLLAFLDEMLPPGEASTVEQALRESGALRQRAALLIRMRDQGGHTLGEIWRRNRLSCPSRSDLGGYLLGTLSPERHSYIEFHIDQVGCRVCSANLDDLKTSQQAGDDVTRRRQRYFESSAGTLPNRD